MLCLQDCLDFADLPQDTIDAIAEHEHVPEIVAAELGCTLIQSLQGTRLIHQYLEDNMEHAAETGDRIKLGRLRQITRDFEREHPA